MSRKYCKLIALALVVGSTPALAQPSGAQAETLFRHGKELMAKGRFAEACAAFDASQKLDPTVATLLNQASCREKNGQLATAWGLFLEAERQTRAATDEPTKQLHQVAANHASKLEPRLSTLTITVSAENRVGGLQVMRNTEPVDPGAWNKALPIDGGTYKITATAPGNADWSSMITVGNERDARTIEIPKLKAAALGKRDAPASPTAPHRAEPEATGATRSKILPLALGGAALALAGGAIGFELSASSTYDRSKVEEDDSRQTSLWHSATTRRYIAQGLGAASLACAGVAIWRYLRLRPGDDEASPRTRQARIQIVPVIDSDRTGLLVTGRY